MVSTSVTSSSPFLFNSSATFGSSSAYDSSTSSPATTTQLFNVLSANAGKELTTVQHYNDIIRTKNTNMDSRNFNPEMAEALMVLSKDGPKSRWHSFREGRSSYNEPSKSKITNTTKADRGKSKAKFSIEDDEDQEKSQYFPTNDNTAVEKPLNIRGPVLPRDQTVIHVEKLDDRARSSSGVAMTSFINRGTSLKERILGPRDRSASRKKERGSEVKRTRSLMPPSLKRNRFWSTINKSIDPPGGRRPLQDRATVPTLHIWLSSDQAPRELNVEHDEPVLNNTREPLPSEGPRPLKIVQYVRDIAPSKSVSEDPRPRKIVQIQLDQPRVIYRSASEGNRWPAPADGTTSVTNQHRKAEPQPPVADVTGVTFSSLQYTNRCYLLHLNPSSLHHITSHHFITPADVVSSTSRLHNSLDMLVQYEAWALACNLICPNLFGKAC
ncbi:uncharacterized protein LOC125177812 [Hyalella azteca]|uniref:Uncharacterized protein LOC125177812 n=1 Tax=Hyalella azteca TaxID=294128 RepID=A0A979FH15_HYAAZ|nr:uncharacterized protein LOC125177812 [Hyalella azteca]